MPEQRRLQSSPRSASRLAPLGRRIRRARKAVGLTQAELGQGMVSAAYVSRVESGTRVPSRRVLEHFADRVSVPLDDLLGEAAAIHWSRLSLADVHICLMRGDLAGAQEAARNLHRNRGALEAGAVTDEVLDMVDALIELETGRVGDAREKLERLAQHLPMAPSGLMILAALCRCYVDLGLALRAVEAARRIASDLADLGLSFLPEAVSAANIASAALAAVGETDEAEAILRLVLRLRSDRSGADDRVVEDLIHASEHEASLGRIAEAASYAERAGELLEHLRHKQTLAELSRSNHGH